MEALDRQPVKGDRPLSMEKLGLDYGFVLYRTSIVQGGTLRLATVHDRAYVFLDQAFLGLIERANCSVTVEVPGSGVLDILVESMGRLNYGAQMTDRKGILGDVTLNGGVL